MVGDDSLFYKEGNKWKQTRKKNKWKQTRKKSGGSVGNRHFGFFQKEMSFANLAFSLLTLFGFSLL